MIEDIKRKLGELESANSDMTPPDSPPLKKYNFTVDPMSELPFVEFLGRMPWKKSVDIRASRLGIGLETLDRDSFDPKKIYPFLAESGVKWGRCQTGWMKTERQAGIYDFRWLDDIVDNLREIGIQAWFSLSYGNPLYTPSDAYAEMWRKAKEDGKAFPASSAKGYVSEVPYYHGEEAMEAWRRYVIATAVHFKGRVSHWEVWNEPEGFWKCNGRYMGGELGLKQTARDYVEFVKFTAAAVRSVIPDAKIIADVAQTGTVYIRELGKSGLGEVIDIFSYHFYGPVPEFFMRERVEHICANIIPHGKHVEIWQGESGRASGPSALFAFPTEFGQAKYLTRRYVMDAILGVNVTSFFTAADLLEYYPDGSDSHYGVIDTRHNRPKLAYHALQRMGWLFDGLESAPDFFIAFTPHNQRNRFGSILPYHVTCGSFRRKGIPLFCVWIPEHVEISAQPLEGMLQIVTEADASLKEPVVIDPIRGNVWALTGNYRTETYDGDFMGALQIGPFRVTDYPLFITESAIFKELFE